MSSYQDKFNEHVDGLFSNVERSALRDIAKDPRESQREPMGWVENSRANVRIDDDGLHVSDGAIFIEDAFGQTVLSGAGFSATWVDFIDSHVYNHSFRAGTTNVITAISEINGGNTIADYEASISDDIPYWVVDVLSGTGTLKRVVDTAAVSGYALQWDGDINAEIYQDIPISPGQVYSTYITWKRTADASNTFFTVVESQFCDESHALIGSPSTDSQLYDTTSSTYSTQGVNWTAGAAPGNARYLRVRIAITRNAGSPTVAIAAVNVDPINVYGPQQVIEGTTTYSTGYGIGWRTAGGITQIALIGDTSSSGLTLQDPTANGVFFQMKEMTAPSAPSANYGKLFLRDNGAGKTQLCIIFNTGAIQVIATQP